MSYDFMINIEVKANLKIHLRVVEEF
jgi:hypothetical protein